MIIWDVVGRVVNLLKLNSHLFLINSDIPKKLFSISNVNGDDLESGTSCSICL